MSKSTRVAAIVLLFFLPAALRLIPIRHGLPENYLPDTHIVRSALGMAKDKNPVPPVLKYSSYPNLLPYCLLPIYATQYVAGRVSGEWGGAEEFGHVVQSDPARVHLPARLLVALFGILTPWVVFRTARAAGLQRGAWVAAWLVTTGLLHTHFSVQERPWVPMVFFFALSGWPAVRYASDPRPRWLLLSGVAAGLAFATHQAGLGALGISGFAWLLSGPGWRGQELRSRLLHGVGAVALFGVVSLALGHPYLLVHGPPPQEEFAGAESWEETDAPSFSIAGQAIRLQIRPESFTRLSAALFGYDPVLLILGVLGIPLALRRRATRAPTAFALLWAAFFMTNQNDHVRYLLPLCVLLAWPAGCLAERLWNPRWGRGALVLALALALAQSARLGWVLTRSDTREAAGELLAGLPAGSRVVIDRYGPVVALDAASLDRISEWRELRTREAFRRERLRVGVEPDAGLDAVRVEDFLLFDDRRETVDLAPGRSALGTTAAEALTRLGATHVLLVRRYPDGARAHPLASLLSGEPIAVVDPSAEELASEAYLPMEMRFPLRGLWQVSRPGPWMGLYEWRP